MPINDSPRRTIINALAFTGGYLALTLALVWATPEYVGRELSMRLHGAMLGLLTLIYANAAPKTLTPLARVRDPIAEQAFRRFVGWTLSLGSAAYMLAWLTLPIEYAGEAALALLLSAAIVVAVRVVRCMRRSVIA